MLARLREAMKPGGNVPGPGPLRREEFDAVTKSLDNAGLLHRPVSYEQFHVQP